MTRREALLLIPGVAGLALGLRPKEPEMFRGRFLIDEADGEMATGTWSVRHNNNPEPIWHHQYLNK